MFRSPAEIDTEGRRRPLHESLITVSIIAVCVIEFLLLISSEEPLTWADWAQFGYLPPARIRGGAWWSLIASALLHQNFWHLAFNVFWTWELGSRLERHLNKFKYSLFCLSAAFVSSAVQLAVTDDPGIGMSGVLYAMFGFMWVSRNRSVEFQSRINRPTTQLFVIWLFACVVLDLTGVMNVGNAAHFAGIIFGALVSAVFEGKKHLGLTRAALSLLIIASVVPLVWCPWSINWLSERAYAAHAAQRFPAALDLYSRIIELDPKNSWAFQNRSSVYLSLGELAKSEADMKVAQSLDPSLAVPPAEEDAN